MKDTTKNGIAIIGGTSLGVGIGVLDRYGIDVIGEVTQLVMQLKPYMPNINVAQIEPELIKMGYSATAIVYLSAYLTYLISEDIKNKKNVQEAKESKVNYSMYAQDRSVGSVQDKRFGLVQDTTKTQNCTVRKLKK